MHQLQVKRTREETLYAPAPQNAVLMEEGSEGKKWRSERDNKDNDVMVNAANVITFTGPTPIKQIPQEEEGQMTDSEGKHHNQQQQSSVNGISPDMKDECDADDIDDAGEEEEVVLFSNPEIALGGVDAHEKDAHRKKDPHVACHSPRQASGSRGGCAPDVQGAVTILHSLQQLEMMFGSSPVSVSDANAADASSSRLQVLKPTPGETVIAVLHRGKAQVRELLKRETRELSMCRIFSLDLGALPASEYDNANVAAPVQGGNGENTVIGVLHSSDREGAMSFSSQIVHGTDRVMQRVCAILHVEDVLNANSNNNDHSVSQQSVPGTQQCGNREELVLPAMVMWHAEGGPEDEYNRERNTSSHCMSQSAAPHGSPLVVKQLTSVDQLHSLSLLLPVYTLEHLLRCVAKTAIFPASFTNASLGSRTLIYFGASWCPPCMRIVNVLPEMMKNDFPQSLTCAVKADMDLATPVFEFFGVEIIPTFVMLDNDVLRQAGGWDAIRNSQTTPESLQQLREGLRRSELGRIQNSQRFVVSSFIERYSEGLKFDEDF